MNNALNRNVYIQGKGNFCSIINGTAKWGVSLWGEAKRPEASQFLFY